MAESKAERDARLKAALRDNLRTRKAQEREIGADDKAAERPAED